MATLEPTPCKEFLKIGTCFNGAYCRLLHIPPPPQRNVLCPDFYDCKTQHCACLHATQHEYDEYRWKQDQARRERDDLDRQSKREAAELASLKDFKQRHDNVRQARLEKSAMRKANKAKNKAEQEAARAKKIQKKQQQEERRQERLARLESKKQDQIRKRKDAADHHIENRTAYLQDGDEELARWLAVGCDFTDEYEELLIHSRAFASINIPAREAATNTGVRLPSGKLASLFPRIDLNGNLEWIKLVWIEYLVSRGIWRTFWDATTASDSELQKREYSNHFTWNDAATSAFRRVIMVFFRFTDLGSHNTAEFVEWIRTSLKITAPHITACLLTYGFRSDNTTVARHVGQQMQKDPVTNPAHFRIILRNLSHHAVEELLHHSKRQVTISMLLGYTEVEAGAFLRHRFFKKQPESYSVFETFATRFGKLLNLLEEVMDTPLFEHFFCATLDDHYSHQHYKAARLGLAQTKWADFQVFGWYFGHFDESLRADWNAYKSISKNVHGLDGLTSSEEEPDHESAAEECSDGSDYEN